MKFSYVGNCTHLSGNSIRDMVDDSREITFGTFKSKVGASVITEFEETLGYRNAMSVLYNPKLRLDTDYAVTFYKSKYKGKNCYFFCHSCIEFVFTERN